MNRLRQNVHALPNYRHKNTNVIQLVTERTHISGSLVLCAHHTMHQELKTTNNVLTLGFGKLKNSYRDCPINGSKTCQR